ncbi:hypothetical protein [Flavobacterium sp.]|uniref:hypothetical protein n=1 Tax=Flavobacterium sp. TaxID=239 RepID=UPI003752E6D0
MKITKLILNFLFLFLINISSAQLKSAFEKGSIILKDNKKIEGFIKTDDITKLATEICFKELFTDKDCKNYVASTLHSFSTENGKFFESLTIKTNKNTTEITLFANLILKGECSLYKCSYNDKDIYVVKNNANNYVLQNDELISGETEIRKYNYRGILNIATDGFSNTNKVIEFNENSFIKIITEYNSSIGLESKVLTYNEKKINYLIATIGGGFKQNESEYFFQGIYRIYYPKISRSTSLNFGLNYFYNKNSQVYNNVTYNFTSSLISLPVQLQQNFLNEKFRPYITAGFNLNYLKVVDKNDNSILFNGLQNNIGIGIVYGTGIEFDLYKGLLAKCEYKFESYRHVILFGIGYNFSK